MYGIDISEHNGNINLEPYKGQFVIIRAGYGRSTVDKKFTRNVTECIRLNIPFGIYWYSYALSKDHARQEAEKCLATIKPYKDKIKVGVWFDMEDADHYKQKNGAMRADLISAMCRTFCEIVEKAGYYTGIYSSKSWFGTYIRGCDAWDKWVANWGINDGKVNVNTSAMGTLLQYTSKPLDKDLMYADISRYSPKEPEAYAGKFPTKFPKQDGMFTIGDGYEKNTSFKTQIKRVQKICNWVMGTKLTVDGCYGTKTKKAVLNMQRHLGLSRPHGNYGPRTNELAKLYRKGV